MPKIDRTKWEGTAESGAKDFKNMTPGIYDCIITGVQTEWTTRGGLQTSDERQCVRLVLDVAEGEFAHEFGRDFYEGRDYMHVLYMSWGERALGMLKHTFHGLEEANPGFDAMAAFEADNWTMFVGKRCRVAWNGREYTNDRGDTKVSVQPDRILCSDDEPRIKIELEDGRKVDWADYEAAEPVREMQPASSAYDSDPIPF